MIKHLVDQLKNRFYLRGVSSSKGLVALTGRPSIENKGRLEMGAGLVLRSDIHRCRLAVKEGANLSIGDHCYLNGAMVAATLSVTIGNHCRLAPFVHIMDGDFHDLEDRALPGESAPVVLKDHVKVGTRCIILKGVTIHEGAAISPGSIVTKDVPAHTLVGGIPAKHISYLHTHPLTATRETTL